MAEQKQFLRLTIASAHYLLPSASGYNIEQRENLLLNQGRTSRVSAWRVVRNQRAPAYALDADLQVTHRDDWQRAVFIGTDARAVGLIVDDVYLMPKAMVAPLVPLGRAPTTAGHLFSDALVAEQQVTLVFEPQALVAYLIGLGD